VVEPFTERLVAKARAMRVGNGLEQGVDMGPAVSQQQLESNLKYVQGAVGDGAKLLAGGRRLTEKPMRTAILWSRRC
jgi:alpha-ketoglutaric semialdehyde dehydrogenase